MSLNRFESMGELVEFVALSDEIARGRDESLHLFEFPVEGSEGDKDPHVFWVIGPQLKDPRVDSFITSMTLKSLQRGYMSPRDTLYFTTIVDFDWSREMKGEKAAKTLRVLERWLERTNPKCIISFMQGTSAVRGHQLTTPIHEKLSELSEKPLSSTELVVDDSANTVYGKFLNACIKKGTSILEFGLDASQRSFEECSLSEWKLSTGPAFRWMIESLPFRIAEAPEMPVLEIIPPLEIPAELNL